MPRCHRCRTSIASKETRVDTSSSKTLRRAKNLTVRELIGKLGGGRGHRTFAGTPEQVADELTEWFDKGAADGFNIMPPYLPGGLEVFVDRVVPILQARGIFRTEYTESTPAGSLRPRSSGESVFAGR